MFFFVVNCVLPSMNKTKTKTSRCDNDTPHSSNDSPSTTTTLHMGKLVVTIVCFGPCFCGLFLLTGTSLLHKQSRTASLLLSSDARIEWNGICMCMQGLFKSKLRPLGTISGYNTQGGYCGDPYQVVTWFSCIRCCLILAREGKFVGSPNTFGLGTTISLQLGGQ